jgi:hypothetical protein
MVRDTEWQLGSRMPGQSLHCGECGNEIYIWYVFHDHEDGRFCLCIERCGRNLPIAQEVLTECQQRRYPRFWAIIDRARLRREQRLQQENVAIGWVNQALADLWGAEDAEDRGEIAAIQEELGNLVMHAGLPDYALVELYWITPLVAVKLLANQLGYRNAAAALDARAWGRREVAHCQHCGGPRYATSRSGRIEACEACPAVVVEPVELDPIALLRSLSYSDYLLTEHWQQMRKAALHRAGYACQLCNASDTQLDVHHRTYERLGQEDEMDLTVLCRRCHSRFHGKA